MFIPGKNWRLSLAELFSVLEARKVRFEVCAFSKEFFILNLHQGREIVDVAGFGGLIKTGNVSKCFSTGLLKEAFLRKNKEKKVTLREEITSSHSVADMLDEALGKYIFGVSVYNAEETLNRVANMIQRYVGSTIKHELREKNVKASFMGFSRDRHQPQLIHIEVLKKGMVENKSEALLCIGKEKTWLATTTSVHNPFEFQKRDLDKPRQRRIFAMPPRLARIMVNLSFCTGGKVLLDPFCGVGTILLEALLAEATVVGLDLNNWCVEAAKMNLKWLSTEYGLRDAKFRILRGDALDMVKKIGQGVDCVVTEPDLGPALRDVPTTPYALRIVEKLKPLYFCFLEEAYKVLVSGGRLVFVTPYFKTRSGRPVKMPIGERAEEIGFKAVLPFHQKFFADDRIANQSLIGTRSLVDVNKRHRVSREIHIFQK